MTRRTSYRAGDPGFVQMKTSPQATRASVTALAHVGASDPSTIHPTSGTIITVASTFARVRMTR